QEAQVEEKRKPNEVSIEVFDELSGGSSCPTRSEYIVVDKNVPSGLDGVFVHLNLRASVLKRILNRPGLVRQLTCFPDGNETTTQFVRQYRSEDKTTGFDGSDSIYARTLQTRCHFSSDTAK